MLKKVLIIMVFIFASHAVAQKKIGFGIKAGGNYTDVAGWVVDISKSKVGFHFGIVTSYEISEKFSVTPELTYSRQGFNYGEIEVREPTNNEIIVFEIINHLDYLNLPILGTYAVVPNFGLQFGPQFGFNIDAKNVLKYKHNAELNDPTPFEQTQDINTLELGIAVGVQLKLSSHVFIQGRYIFGITSVFPNSKVQNRNAQLSMGYNF
ncbi:MAG: PorT family protein [Altibacter sp.]|uniref:porin family protein n=1 Tax=Altibacter sp. TaxID=2024823 RepID=UPI001D8D2136|nr:porin family protein [Altibacter sp.]MBZ0326689.1 PorT family protein [Altibacter sp.]